MRTPPPSTRHLDENALDQAESLAEQGRYDEARAVLHQQLRILPNHPLVLERLADIDAAASSRQSVSHSGPYPMVPPAPSSQPLPLRSEPPPAPYAPPPARPAYGSELDPVLEQVRAGVRHQVSDADSATHYDLGVAYLEMGLHSDAISELTLAARDPKRELVCLSTIAGILRDHLGDLDAALDALHRALNAAHRTRDQEAHLGYELADTYEQKKMPDKALHYFEWLAKSEPNYDDPRGSVQERIQRLRTESGAQRRPQAPAAKPLGDEVENAFDDLFGDPPGSRRKNSK
jgi:tetratricopeptide (TPR) repeat protein